MISPSCNLRLSGIPWQMTSLTDLDAINLVRNWYLEIWQTQLDVRAHGLGVVAIVKRGWVRVAVDGGLVHNRVDLIRSDARANGRGSYVKNLAGELHTHKKARRRKRGG